MLRRCRILVGLGLALWTGTMSGTVLPTRADHDGRTAHLEVAHGGHELGPLHTDERLNARCNAEFTPPPSQAIAIGEPARRPRHVQICLHIVPIGRDPPLASPRGPPDSRLR